MSVFQCALFECVFFRSFWQFNYASALAWEHFHLKDTKRNCAAAQKIVDSDDICVAGDYMKIRYILTQDDLHKNQNVFGKSAFIELIP